ncbi:MAG TPA: polyprenyl synthetase family protein [Actinomycetota bacterium]|nr:polyprenyl synthetase family protein [Actinomycetota bacterium]
MRSDPVPGAREGGAPPGGAVGGAVGAPEGPPGFAVLRQALDGAVAAFLSEQRARMAGLAPASARLVDLVELAVASGGKRLRPMLCYCAYRAAGGAHGPEILNASGSLELLHTFAILHDDVMDQATLRRGRPALHRRLADERRAGGRGEDAEVFGVSVAVLAGDLALVLSDAMLTSSGFGAAALARAVPALEQMRRQAIAGQYLDLAQAGGPPVGAADAVLIGRLKTAGYSVEGPIAVGAALAGAPEELRAALRGFGVAVGEAFFLRDELLGLFGDPEATGKDADSDLRRGKPTSLMADALARSGPAEREVLLGRWGDPDATVEELAALRAAVASTGALRAAAQSIDALIARARECLRDAGVLHEPPGAMLAALADRLQMRSLPISLG